MFGLIVELCKTGKLLGNYEIISLGYLLSFAVYLIRMEVEYKIFFIIDNIKTYNNKHVRINKTFNCN